MISNLGAKFAVVTFAAAVAAVSFAPAAVATPINYDFTVQASNGGLAGTTGVGSFSYDSNSIIAGGKKSAINLLTALDFTFNGIAYDATTANTGFLSFDALGALTGFSFGNNCSAGGCRLRPGSESWLVDLKGFAYTARLANGRFTSGSGPLAFQLAPTSVPVPEPATLGLFGLGALVLGLFVRARRRVA